MIKIEVEFPDLYERLKKYEKEIMLVLAASMQTNRSMMFDADGADNGKKKWAPLKFRNGRPLQDRGTLRKSMGPSNDGITPGRGVDSVLKINTDSVMIGTKLAYARMMNDGTTKMPGGVLRPINAQALKIPLPMGKNIVKAAKALRKGAAQDSTGQKYIFRKSVRIPARPMDEITPQDEQEWVETVQNYMMEILTRG